MRRPWLPDMGLQGRLLVVLLPLVAAALVTVGYGGYLEARRDVIEHRRQDVRERADAQARELNHLSERVRTDLLALSRHGSIEAYHRALVAGQADQAETARSLLAAFLAEYRRLSGIYLEAGVLGADGTWIVGVGPAGAISGTAEPAIRDAAAHAVAASAARGAVYGAPLGRVLGPPRDDDPEGAPIPHEVLRHAVALRGEDGSLYATVLLGLDFDVVRDLIGGGPERAFLLGRDGSLLAGWAGAPELRDARIELVQAASLGPGLRELVLAHGLFVQDEDRLMVGYAPAAEGRWVIGIASPYRDFLASIAAMRTRTFGWLALSLLLVTLAVFFVVRTLLRPIRRLTDATTAARQGRLEPVEVTGAYEIAELARSFNEMSAAIESSLGETTRLKNHLETVMESMPSALSTLDHDGRVSSWNWAAEAITGIPRDQAHGRVLWELGTELGRYRDAIQQVLASGARMAFPRQTFRLPSGERRLCDVTLFALAGPAARGVAIRTDDVTARDRLERLMVQSEKMASVGALAAGMAHEINNPLGGILQNAQNLVRRLDTTRPLTRERLAAHGLGAAEATALTRFLEAEHIPRYTAVIMDCGQRAAHIVRNLLDFSRRGARRMERHAIGEVIDRTLELAFTEYDLEKRYDFRNLVVVKTWQGSGPDVLCDPQELQQVVLNLLKNAAHAMHLKSQKLVGTDYHPILELGAVTRDGLAVIEVRDNGPGIPADVLPHIFAPFYTTKEPGDGTGLGLSISHFIVVDGHGGNLRVETRVGEGTRFFVELPVADVGATPGPQPIPEGPSRVSDASPTARAGAQLRVLVVDDQAYIREGLRDWLEDEGFEVALAANADEAIAAAAGVPLDACVVDVRLPGTMDGTELVLYLRRQIPALRIVIHTGSQEFRLPESLSAIGIGEADVLFKPLDGPRLRERLLAPRSVGS